MTIGTAVRRVEDERLLKGNGYYVGDVHFPGQCEAAILRSQHAHAKIESIDYHAAISIPGVIRVFTANDLPADLKPIPMRLSPEKSLEYALQYPLAKEIVRYVGEPIAVVVAENRYIAEDALDYITVKYQPLPPVTSVEEALRTNAPILHEKIGSNDLYVIRSKKGEAKKFMKDCPFVVEKELYVQRHSGIPMETRGVVANPQANGSIDVFGAAKVVHFNQRVLADLLNMEMEKVRLVELNVGGGFGVRGEFYPEDFLIPFIALQIKRPVRWVEDRLEHMKTTNHSREQKHHLKIGFDETGRIHAFIDEIFVDTGSYIRTHGITVPELTQGMIPGPYDFRHIEINTHVVSTNKPPIGTYRGPGRFEGTFVRERMIDIVAKYLGLDPAIVRERNLIQPEQMPYTNGISALGQQIEFDSGNYPSIIRHACKLSDWKRFDEKKKAAHEKRRLIGKGMAMFVEKSGFGPWEYAEVELTADGEIVCKSGLADVGQGVKTMLSQICSEQLGVPYQKIRVFHGDTRIVKKGNGAFATRGTVVGGNAAWHASKLLKEKILDIASDKLQLAKKDLYLSNESVIDVKNDEVVMSLKEVAHCANKDNIPLKTKYTFHADHMNYPYGVHTAEVEIDPDTGKVTLLDYQIVYDVGKAINPLLIEGQLIGGMAQGLGGSLYEELKYDDMGQLITGTFMDYLIPTANEVPEVKTAILEDAPSPLNELGVKGAGEGGTVAVAPAIANAIMNALEGYDFEITSLPIRPEIIRHAIKRGKGVKK